MCCSLFEQSSRQQLVGTPRMAKHRQGNEQMQSSRPSKPHWASTDANCWYRWRGYTVRWLLFGGITGLFQPIVDDLDHYWLHRLHQFLFGLFFGSVCAVVFTLAENSLNAQRVNWKSWSILISTWLAVKLVFVSVMAAAG